MVAGHSLANTLQLLLLVRFKDALIAVSARGREMASVQIDDPGNGLSLCKSRVSSLSERLKQHTEAYVVSANSTPRKPL